MYADLLAKLQSLGYVSAGGSNSESVTARNNAGVALIPRQETMDGFEKQFGFLVDCFIFILVAWLDEKTTNYLNHCFRITLLFED